MSMTFSDLFGSVKPLPKKPCVFSFAEEEEPVVEKVEEAKEEAVETLEAEEAAVVIEIPEEESAPEAAAEETETEPEAEITAEETEPAAEEAEEKPKKSSKKKTDKTEETSEFTNVKFEPQKLKLKDIRRDFSVTMQDKEWETQKAELIERVKSIKIEPNINRGSARILLAQCSNVLSDLLELQSPHVRDRNVFSGKVSGLISRQEDVNAVGKNEAERKINSRRSCEEFQFEKDGKKYNLYDLDHIVEDRLVTVEYLIKDVEQKQRTLVGFLSIMKLESGVVE